MTAIPQAFAIAIQHHQAGRLQAAEQIYRQILASEPNHADALHLLGVIASQAGKHEIAVEYIERAIRLQGNAAYFHNNLGEAYRAMRRMPEAIACFRRALELAPDAAEIHNNMGNALKAEGRPDESLACYRRALALNPDFAEAYNNLGNILKIQGKLDEAVACYRRAMALKPGYAEAHNNLGNTLKNQGKLDEAVACYRQALALKPGYAEAHNNLGVAFKDQGKLDEAVACYRRAREVNPGFAEAHYNLGIALKEQGLVVEALACFRRALELKPDFAEACVSLAVACYEQGNLNETVACYRRALELKPDFVEAHCNLGIAFKDLGKLDEAVACCRQALDLRPDFAEAHCNLGIAFKGQGKLDEAVACYRRAVELKPDFAEAHSNLGIALKEIGDLRAAEDSFRVASRCNPRSAFAHHQLAELLGGELPDDEMAAQRRLLEQGSASGGEGDLADSQRLLLHFGLARVLDARGEYAEAAEHSARGNAMQRSEWRKRGLEYDPAEYELLVARMIAVCTPDFFELVRGFGLESEVPVFVVGLPRSGTTLIEQILASHSQVFGAGEINLVYDTVTALAGKGADFLVERLREMDRETAQHHASQHLERLPALNPTVLRIVDKMPDNYLFLGLMAGLFPRAKYIHCRRDLRDVAVSCWMTHFQNIRWANDEQHIASRFRQYQRLMSHWRTVLPVRLLEVDYEETVADLEGAARRLVAWCGLEWEPACLEFHRATRPVTTASVVQVRQPVFRTSAERWKHYEKFLVTLLSAIPGRK